MIKTKRWCDPVEADDGFRVLIARYRPRGVSKADETWTAFLPQLGPSKALHAAYYHKDGVAIAWPDYAQRYLAEMNDQRFFIQGLADHVRAGKTLTLLCSSACTDPRLCHRSLLLGLIEAALADAPPPPPRVVRRKS